MIWDILPYGKAQQVHGEWSISKPTCTLDHFRWRVKSYATRIEQQYVRIVIELAFSWSDHLRERLHDFCMRS